MNGTHKTEYVSTVVPERTAERTPETPSLATRQAPAETFLVGRILTRVWANQTSWGEIAWRVDQYRLDSDGRGVGRFHTLYPKDVNDAMRGLYRAQRWIRRTDRRRQRRAFWGW
ncbi:MAG: hypothetical protein AB7U20_03880 [Planctomycetaceae bacterium]